MEGDVTNRIFHYLILLVGANTTRTRQRTGERSVTIRSLRRRAIRRFGSRRPIIAIDRDGSQSLSVVAVDRDSHDDRVGPEVLCPTLRS
ncbi:hypothetical protein BRC68_03065 [Halobacteriales archaeon QH_6_64_20]|nr:MAG: hypothetical protein BRC68_03065 [Halobacteriales archaeon QH_6_64_20]